MVHQYKNNGYNMALDVASGSVHVVDDLTYEVIALYEDHTLEEIIKELSSWDEKDVKESYGEVTELKDAGVLFTEDCYEEYICGFKDRPTVVKALCLHIAHDCNLACRYCFAEEGEYKGRRALMSAEVGKKALDFLVENSGNRRNLEVDFFGGEPLMNFDVVKGVIEYARSIEKQHNKNFRFTITTNGLLLTDDKIEYINKEMNNVVLSLDGRKEVNDRLRITPNGKGCYDIIVPKYQNLVQNRGDKDYYIRGTFTRYNLDFTNDVLHMKDLGFEQLSIEPVVSDPLLSYSIKTEDLPAVFDEYERLAKTIVESRKKGEFYNFFHFMIDLDQGPCAVKRLRGCGCGNEYVAVTPEGDIYPCHQFVGEDDYKMGNLNDGTFDEDMKARFALANVYSKDKCKNCWAKFYCSGGCNANNFKYEGDIRKSHETSCELEKKRLECAIAIKAALAE